MAGRPVRIESLAEGQRVLGGSPQAARSALVVPVRSEVPEWLGTLVEQAHQSGATVCVRGEPGDEVVGEALHGWEIGVCTAALAAGADDVIAIDPRRVQRVRAVVAALDGAARQELAT